MHTHERPLGRPDIAVHSWFSPGRQGLRITLILLINITITEMNDDGTFCMECSKIKLADDPSPLPSHPHFAPTVSVAVSFVVVVLVVVLTPFNVLPICLSFFIIIFFKLAQVNASRRVHAMQASTQLDLLFVHEHKQFYFPKKKCHLSA